MQSKDRLLFTKHKLEHLVIVSTDTVTTASNAFIHTVHYFDMQ
jgi:hypothetical protein